jgi:hypothetical protein
MALHAHGSVLDAAATPMSVAGDFFGSKAFADYAKSQEATQRVAEAILRQIGNVTMAVGNLGKALAGRR